MSANRLPRLVTIEEYEQMDSDLRLDLIEGELWPMPPMPGAEHGGVTYDFAFEVGLFVRQNNLGRCFAAETRFAIEFDPATAIGPDLAFVRADRLPDPLPAGFLRLAPDLVLEVRSPSDRAPEVLAKVRRWLAAGVRLVWELNTRTRILTVYQTGAEPQTLGINDTLTGGDLLPGFSFALRRLFPAG